MLQKGVFKKGDFGASSGGGLPETKNPPSYQPGGEI